jgi:hypothetical protein
LSKPTKVEHEERIAAEGFELGAETDLGPVILDEIRSQGHIFLLNQPLQIEVSRFAGGWCYESELLAILAFGRSKQEVLDSFTEDFSVLWDTIAQVSDESLTTDALAVKHAFQALVRAVSAE